VKITFDPAKRAVILKTRGLDVLDAAQIFAGPTATWRDDIVLTTARRGG
jgi:uncharacterized DUF497 family protein